MFIPKKKHQRNRIIQLIHLLEIRHLIQITHVQYCEILHPVGDAVEHFVLPHAVGVPVAAEADHDQALFFGHYGLVDVPACYEVGEDDGTHGLFLVCVCFFVRGACVWVGWFGER